MAKKPKRRHAALRYPKHVLSPEDLLHFIETTVFTKAWGDLGLNDEEDLTALQVLIMCSPKAAPVIPATGGLRKLRFAPAKWETGASGGVRVCYVYFEEHAIVLLVYVYDKREGQSDPSRNEGNSRLYPTRKAGIGSSADDLARERERRLAGERSIRHEDLRSQESP